jgi:2-keto-3-deoxy-L-rhamnonate aldolase RhmA
MNLKKRIHSGNPLYIATGRVDMSDEKLADCAAEKPDLLFVDLQHTPYTEPQLVDFCARCEKLDVPPLIRIRHPHLHTMIGSYLDFGAAGILVPMTEQEEVVDRAINSFYYPPQGERSWFPQYAWKRSQISGLREYADWWSENGILAIQIETVRGVQNVRKLVKDGVDLILFGAVDLMFSLEANPDSGFATIADCQRHVMEQVADLPVRVAIGDMPFGQFED